MEMDDAETLYPNPHVSTTSSWAPLYPTSSWGPGNAAAEVTQGHILQTVYTWKEPGTFAWDVTEDNLIQPLDFMAGTIPNLTRNPIPPGYDVFLLQLRFGRLNYSVFDPSPNGHGTTTEGAQLSAKEIAMLPGASTRTKTAYAEFLGSFGTVLFMSTHRIMTAISSPPPPGAHVYWDTVMWEIETRVTTAPNYGTLTEYIWWTVVEREVHMSPGFPIAGLQTAGTFSSSDPVEPVTWSPAPPVAGLEGWDILSSPGPAAPTTWSQTVYAGAGEYMYDGGKKKKDWKVSDAVIDEWLIRKMWRGRKMRRGRRMRRGENPQCGKKNKKKVKRVVKRKRTTVRFVKETNPGKEASTRTNLPSLPQELPLTRGTGGITAVELLLVVVVGTLLGFLVLWMIEVFDGSSVCGYCLS